MASLTASSLRLDQDYAPGNKRKAKSPGIVTKRIKNESMFGSEDNTTEVEEDIQKQYQRFQNSAKYNSHGEEVFCVCRRPDHGGELMISCDGCDEWFHFVCMKIDTRDAALIDKFFCKFCEWKGLGETMWKRHCRLEGCRKPIVSESKYCSRDHGLQYVRLELDAVKTKYNPRKMDLKRVLEVAGGSHVKFMMLGTLFPELPQAVEYVKTHDLNLFPEEIREDLKTIDESIQQLSIEKQKKDFAFQFLAKYKEKVKITNELYTQKMVPIDASGLSKASGSSGKLAKRKGKQPKTKKYEICLFHNVHFENPSPEMDAYMKRLVASDNIQEEFEVEINKIVDEMIAKETGDDSEVMESISESKSNDWILKICKNDRKKCVRHNGWWNLLVDKIQKEINEVNKSTEMLQKEAKKLLRDFSIQEYEQERA